MGLAHASKVAVDSLWKLYLTLGKVRPLGRVAEWSIAAVLKTAEVQASVGSNPTPSARGIVIDI